jgi:hypothetical protein
VMKFVVEGHESGSGRPTRCEIEAPSERIVRSTMASRGIVVRRISVAAPPRPARTSVGPGATPQRPSTGRIQPDVGVPIWAYFVLLVSVEFFLLTAVSLNDRDPVKRFVGNSTAMLIVAAAQALAIAPILLPPTIRPATPRSRSFSFRALMSAAGFGGLVALLPSAVLAAMSLFLYQVQGLIIFPSARAPGGMPEDVQLSVAIVSWIGIATAIGFLHRRGQNAWSVRRISRWTSGMTLGTCLVVAIATAKLPKELETQFVGAARIITAALAVASLGLHAITEWAVYRRRVSI